MYGGLKENVPHGVGHCFPVSGTLGKLRMCGLAGGSMPLGELWEFKYLYHFFSHLYFLLAGQDVNPHLLLQFPHLWFAIITLTLWELSAPINCFFYKLHCSLYSIPVEK